MASNVSNVASPTCPICLGSPPRLKVLETCKHAFCQPCLSTHLKAFSSKSTEWFSCPTCRVECPLPNNGVEALPDYSGDHDTSWIADHPLVSESDESDEESNADADDPAVMCDSCPHTDGSDEAENFCVECDYLNFCESCSDAHGNNTSTKDHTLIPLELLTKDDGEGKCRTHKKWITKFCIECSEPVCQLCVVTKHGEHDLQSFSAIFESKFDEVESLVIDQENRSADLKHCEWEMKGLLCAADLKEEFLINSIEQHTESVIEQILDEKKTMINRVRKNGSEFKDALAGIERIPEAVRLINETVNGANKVLEETYRSPTGLDKLSGVRKDMTELSLSGVDVERNKYLETYQKLWQDFPTFVPNPTPPTIGSLERRMNCEPASLKNFHQVVEKKLNVNDEAKYIPSLAIISKDYYAVAHPTLQGEFSDGVDVYKFPDEFVQTLEDKANPVYDVAATPAEKLAVLTRGTTAESCCVCLFDPVKGFISSTKDLPIARPLSFDVDTRHQYILLSHDEGVQVTIFGREGAVVFSQVVEEGYITVISDARRISCSFGNIYIMSDVGFDIFQRKEDEIVFSTGRQLSERGKKKLKDISVTDFDSTIVAYISSDQSAKPAFVMYKLCDDEITGRNAKFFGKPPAKANLESRLSVGHRFLLSSQGHTIILFAQND